MIDLQTNGAIAVATFDHPPVNAFDDAQVHRLGEIIDAAEADASVGVLVLRSALKVFSAGADLGQMAERFTSTEGRAQLQDYAVNMQKVFARLENSDVVSVAEISGAAMGGGYEMALSCDFRVAADHAKIGLPEAGLGLLPGAGGTQRLTRICGDAVARRIILGAEIVNGEQAARLGMVHWSMPADELRAFVDNLAGRIAGLSRQGLGWSKRCIAAADDPASDGFGLEQQAAAELFASPETQNRIKAFLDRG